MSYIDVLVPFLGGIFLLLFGEKLITTRDASFEKKKGLLKKLGVGLVLVSLIYLVVNFFE
jgi:hypothetical protein